MLQKRPRARALVPALLIMAALGTSEAAAADCRNTGDFGRWLANFKQEAVAAGINPSVVRSALSGVTLNRKVIARDRRQTVFSQDFLTFSGRMVAKYRLVKGRQLLKKYAGTFARVQRQYGVPGPVIVAFWGLETDFGAFLGKMSTIRSVATLAYDCRRPELFRDQLMAVLKIIERGDLRKSQMIGPWAGELGQTQFLPTHYFDHAVDFDGDGRRDLMKSVPDVLASTANYMKHIGWRAGEPWIEEVRVPRRMDWKEADLTIEHPRSQWAAWGVTRPNGQPIKSDGMNASLLLPMGRNGPAFLAYHNFKTVYLEWNNSLIYATTAAYYATRLAGAGPMRKGNGRVQPLTYEQIKRLQQLLVRRGYDVGKLDGIIGSKTRAAVKDMQIKLSMPADSYPTPELLRRLGG